MTNKVSDPYVTTSVFTKAVHGLNEKIDSVAISLIKTQQKVDYIEKVMATKSDVNLILDRIDHFVKKVDVVDKKDLVHDFRLKEIETSLQLHEKRITSLESKQ